MFLVNFLEVSLLLQSLKISSEFECRTDLSQFLCAERLVKAEVIVTVNSQISF